MVAKKKITLKVLFDTNVIFTGSASDLLRKEITDLITSHSSLSDISIEWYLPQTVLQERLFQMRKRGLELLPSIQKLERLLGHNLNITEEIIENRIQDTINKQIENIKLKIFNLQIEKIDWPKIIHNSLNRLPPFEDNEKEKGFRDALIIETLKQVIAASPSTPSVCRIIYISNDIVCRNAALEISSDKKNVYVFEKAEELVSLINILNSEITEELISTIKNVAQHLFFIKEDKTTLYYTENIRAKISEDYAKELKEKPDAADTRENGTWWINPPGFEKKEKQKIFWRSLIEVDFINFKTSYEANPQKSLTEIFATKESSSGLFSVSTQKKDKINEGQTRFEVIWSVTLTTTKKLKSPKIESIKFIDNTYK